LDDSSLTYVQVYGGFCYDSVKAGATVANASNASAPGTSTTTTSNPQVGNLMIAGDGYAYLLYSYINETQTLENQGCDRQDTKSEHLRLLRASTTGGSNVFTLADWTYNSSQIDHIQPGSFVQTAPVPTIIWTNPITNSDIGALVTWEADTPAYSPTGSGTGIIPASSTFAIAATSAANQPVITVGASVPGQATPVQPVLQRADGSLLGTVGVGPQPGNPSQYNMVAFNLSGSPLWTVPAESPIFATADGGVIATNSGSIAAASRSLSGRTIEGISKRRVETAGQRPMQSQSPEGAAPAALQFDINGNETNQAFGNGDSWTGNSYALTFGSELASISIPYTAYALTFQATQSGSLSPGGATSVPPGPVIKSFYPFPLDSTTTLPSQDTSVQNAIDRFMKAIPLTKADTNPYKLQKATLSEFITQLNKRVDAIGYIGHAAPFENPTDDIGLCFSPEPNASAAIQYNCSVPPLPPGIELIPLSKQISYTTIADGFITSAKVVFLGSCDVGPKFLSQWNIKKGTTGQALIVPDFSHYPVGAKHEVPLVTAATAWEKIAQELANGNNALGAMGVANAWLTSQNQVVQFMLIGDASVTIKPIFNN
jgi:hypothetical protein